MALLAACSRGAERGGEQQPSGSAPGEAERQADAALRIPCAHDNAPLADDCTVDRTQTERGTVLIIRHADGGFRRLLVTADGRGVVAADGSQPASVAIVDGGIEVRVAGDRYRLPATVKGGATAS